MNPFNPLPAVVALGGGHGLSASLSALRQLTPRLTAIVTVADDGGSSGRLRDEFPILPPGDLRMALAALCGDDEVGRAWAAVLQSRFPGDGPLGGHSIGNLLIAGLWQQLSDPVAGLDMVAAMLNVEGRVLPMAAVPLVIEAEVIGADPSSPDERTLVVGQEEVALATGDIANVRLVPANPPAVAEALAAVATADYIVLGPGSWYSSVIPHLLVPELARAIETSQARRILTLNLVPTADETPAYTASRHIEVLAEHAPGLRLDAVVADPSFADGDTHLATFVASLGAKLVVAPVRMRDGSARHDPHLLASVYAGIMGL
ncbi:uridine diphosphate-N-acetylglucosamine-binding protein YvcK [Propionicimonas sp.]|uniref:gluconeogenesis factor YvcK family protein n=1 Tax=Propionicimonas sp. TaxID=1955623 RepID=UPI00180ABC9B|nr:uridine diphosphate-N-acetylglucosamine-binding protein YvcK [Propionicimonas sp.]MBU3977606.1 uridine diphosphate-N-acetylglucosamine-binding protein YvcK [Actinomycetota bacterium]MBA3021531.1 uridine diphosphate-N-acetylglucosamine-binding protein YvcK [Propionicimonas sp.]MBU3987080.1 uridine diphosphate-N-acetylglucosamine-binding protein YvcK [Actinomycetota bacterium]MBU4008901.1 uridine diphosphate-N-acetylglucosamine-binding protein YvcK [Actinomycetota bacterium]MBU4065949.1 uridi